MITIPGKIPIRIHPFFWMLIFAIGWINSMSLIGMCIWACVIFVSVLVHEYGHALTALAFGQQANIDLIGMGGLTTRSGKQLKLWQEFVVVLNGPLAGISLYILAVFIKKTLAASEHLGLIHAILNVMIIVNFFWTLLNLIPIQPLDGGRLLSIIMEKLFGLRGVKIALFLSMCLAGALGFFFFYFNNLFAGSIFLIFMFESYRNWKSSLVLTEQDRDTQYQALLKEAEGDLNLGHIQEAQDKLQKLRNAVPSGILYLAATQHLAAIYSRQGDFQAAYDLLKPLAKKLDADALGNLQGVTYRLGHWEEASDIGKGLYRVHPSAETAFINAICEAKLGNKKATFGWLQTSQREGLPNFRQLLKKEEFDLIRDDPAYQRLVDL